MPRDIRTHGHGHDATPVHTMAIVETLTAAICGACAARVGAWHDAGLATPLVLAADEFGRSLDAFPLEFGAIIADHASSSGAIRSTDCSVDAADIRRACEVQARSHCSTCARATSRRAAAATRWPC